MVHVMSTGPFNIWINKLEIKSLKFHAAKKAAVTRPGEYVNKAIWGPRWFLSVQGSWIYPPVLNPRQVSNDGDDVPWIHLDSLIQKKKATLSQKGRSHLLCNTFQHANPRKHQKTVCHSLTILPNHLKTLLNLQVGGAPVGINGSKKVFVCFVCLLSFFLSQLWQ